MTPIPPAVESALSAMEEAMKGRMARLAKDYAMLRTGRANPQLLEPIKVEYYGQPVPLKQVAAISVPEARVLELRPWDPAVLPELEKALQKADVGAMPQNDGKLIRISLPTMTEDRRKDLVKLSKRIAEEARVGIRNDRHDALEKVKKAEKAKEISQDEGRGLEARIQKTTDAYVAKVDAESVLKEKEITTV